MVLGHVTVGHVGASVGDAVGRFCWLSGELSVWILGGILHSSFYLHD